MKKIFLVAILVLALAITFAACGVTHEHTFAADKWSSDETAHWHAATCEHTDVTDGKASHTFVVMPTDKSVEECSVCGYARSTSHKHEMSDKYSSDENGHCRIYLCGCSIPNWAPHGFVNGVCVDCGWWSSATDVLLGQLSNMEVWNYTVLLNDVMLDKVNLLSEGIEQDSVLVNGELKLNITADGQIEGEGYFETASIAMKAVVSKGVVYACGNGKYIRYELNELLAKANVSIEQVQAYADKLNASTQTARKYVELIQQYLTKLSIENETVKQLLDKLVKADEGNDTDKLTAYVLDTDVLRQLNGIIAVTTVQDYVDAAFGEGFFADLPNYVKDLFNVRIGKILLDLRTKYDITLDDILTVANSLIERYYPNKEVKTVEDLLMAKGVDLKGMSAKSWIEFSSLLTLGTALETLQRNSDNPVTVADIIDKVDGYCKAYGDKTLYEVMLADNKQLTNEDVKLLVDKMIDTMDEYIAIEFYLDGNGVLQQVEMIASESVIEEGQPTNPLQQLLNSINGTILLQRGYVTEQDYSKVVEQVNAYYDSLEQSAVNA